MSVAARAFAVWALLMLLESGNGLVRRIFVEQFFDDLAARRIGVAIGSLIVLGVSYVLGPWLRVRRPSRLLLVGLAWTVLTVLFEIVLGRWAFGLSWAQIGSDYDLRAGGAMPLGLLLMTFAPLIGVSMRRRRRVAKRRRSRRMDPAAA